MKKFEFRLERVERWRALQVELQKEKSRKSEAVLDVAKEEALALMNVKAEAAAQIESGGEASALVAYPGFTKKLGRELQSAQAKVARLQSATLAERRRLVEMHRGLCLLERLHASRSSDWQADVDREEERFAGEAFLSRVQSKLRARSSGG